VQVHSLHIYPVKSTAGLALDEAAVEPWGLADDRRWSVIDDAGERLVAWDVPLLLRVLAVPTAQGIRLTAPGRADLEVCYPDSAVRVATPYSRLDSAVPAGAEAACWLSELLGQKVQLLWLDDPRLRPVSSARGGRPGEYLSLADAGPVLLTSLASLAQLDQWSAERAAAAGQPPAGPLAMARFRPNLVIDGELPFAEDGWDEVRVGEVSFRRAMLCDRCVITTIDPVDLSRGREPLRTLARHRRWDGHTWFGVRLVPRSTGVIRVGDPVTVGS
jgi:MOSC domain-containing protein